MLCFGEDELGEAGAALDLDGVADFEEALALSFVAGVPDGGVEHTGVAHEARSGVDVADVLLGDADGLGVPRDVVAGVEFVQFAAVALDGRDFPAIADGLSVGGDASGFALFFDASEGEIDAVGLHLFVGDVAERVGDVRATLEHVASCRERV